MPDTSAIKVPGPQKPGSPDNTSHSVTDTLNSVKAMFPELGQKLNDIFKLSETSSGSGVLRSLGWTKTSRQEVGEIALKLAAGTELTAKDVNRLKTIAQSTKKGSESATRVLEINNTVGRLKSQLAAGTELTAKDVTELTTIAADPTKKGSASAKTDMALMTSRDKQITPLTKKDLDSLTADTLMRLSNKVKDVKFTLTKDCLALLKSIPNAQLFKHGSAELIYKYASTLTAEDKAKFTEKFKQSQTTNTGFTDKYNGVLDMVKWEDQVKSIQQMEALTLEKLTSLKLIPQDQLFTHGSAKLIYKYASTLTAADKAKFTEEFTKSQKTKTGFTNKYTDVFNMARKHAIAKGGAPEKFMQGNTLYTALATTRVNQSTYRAEMEKLSKSLMTSLKTNLSTKITNKQPLNLQEATQIVNLVSQFFKENIEPLTLSPEYVEDLKVLLAEVDTHFTTRKETASEKITAGTEDITVEEKAYAQLTPKEIALTKFKQFTSSYMLQNLSPILAKNVPVGVYLSEITKRAGSMQLYWPGGKLDLPESVNLPTAVFNGIGSLLTMGEKNGLFTPEEVGLIKEEVANLGGELASFQQANASFYPELL